MATLVLVTMAIRVLFARECFRQKSGHVDKPVLNVRANFHKYKMKLLPVWSPRLCDESRSFLHFLGGLNHQACGSRHNILLFSRLRPDAKLCY